MRTKRKYKVAASLLVILAVAFGVFGTVAPPLTEESTPIQPQQESPSESVGHFQNPPTYDSGWVDISSLSGQSITLTHNLNTTEAMFDVVGKSFPDGAEHKKFYGATLYTSGWNQTYGGTNIDSASSMVQASDGGYALAGSTYSYGVGTPSFQNVYVVKTDAAGTMQWNKTYGGANHDSARSLVQASDGGYALAGRTRSYGAGNWDFYLVKTDSTGTMQWNKTYGGTSSDSASSMVQTSDGGYVLAGYTSSFGAGSSDFWLVKTDIDGNLQWNRTYGGTSSEDAYSLVQTSDGGYALAGQTTSGDGSSTTWLVRTDATGNQQWNQTYDPAGVAESAYSLVQTTDGGYALAGITGGIPVVEIDFWLVKTDASGNALWNKAYGGATTEFAFSLVQTSDGGYALAGQTNSFGAGSYDSWLVKTDQAGNMQWNQTYGGLGSDDSNAVIEMDEGGFVLSGSTASYGAGNSDAWLVRTEGELGLSVGLTVTDFTNSTITLVRGRTDPFWNYVRVRIWLLQEPSWIYGDINMDGVVDAQDLYILGRNYGTTFSILSLSGIIAIASIQTYKNKRKQHKPNNKNEKSPNESIEPLWQAFHKQKDKK